MARPRLVVFARAPAIGVGKTRLAHDIGRVEAWRVSRALAARTLWRLRDQRWSLELRLTPDRAGAARPPPDWPPTLLRVGQGGGELGARLERAFHRARGPVAVIGTDAPEISRALVAEAFAAGRRGGAAIGPAEDGGFWLLALSGPRARRVSLAGVRWSGPHALVDTLERVGKAARLPTLLDIDDGEDLRRWATSPTRQRGRRPEQDIGP